MSSLFCPRCVVAADESIDYEQEITGPGGEISAVTENYHCAICYSLSKRKLSRAQAVAPRVSRHPSVTGHFAWREKDG